MPATKRELQRAAQALTNARQELKRARTDLARITTAGSPAHVVDPRWRWAEQLLAKKRRRLLRIKGVISAELGHRVCNGTLTQEACITVYVRKKIPSARLEKRQAKKIPRYVREGNRRLPIDVIELGKLKREADPGRSIGPELARRTGTLGAYAIDATTRRTVAITAMHVSGLKDMPPTPMRFCAPSRQDAPNSSVFATMTDGTMRGIDAAKLDLLQQIPPVTRLPNGRVIAGWRPTAFPGDRGILVHMCGARSGPVSGFIVNPFVPVPDWDLDGAILVNINSREGDSGAALVDSNNFLLGFLAGTSEARGNLRVFVSVGFVLARLRCDVENV